MAVRQVVRLPEAVLKRRAAEVEGIDDVARALAIDLVDTMRASPACVGLAAPQIGVGLRAFAVDVTGHRKARSWKSPTYTGRSAGLRAATMRWRKRPRPRE